MQLYNANSSITSSVPVSTMASMNLSSSAATKPKAPRSHKHSAPKSKKMTVNIVDSFEDEEEKTATETTTETTSQPMEQSVNTSSANEMSSAANTSGTSITPKAKKAPKVKRFNRRKDDFFGDMDMKPTYRITTFSYENRLKPAPRMAPPTSTRIVQNFVCFFKQWSWNRMILILKKEAGMMMILICNLFLYETMNCSLLVFDVWNFSVIKNDFYYKLYICISNHVYSKLIIYIMNNHFFIFILL